ncbi:MAG: uracil-DNA glycosylase [Gammaproteobacteria bacterium]|nr:uracil-DNA glycosylase [Gammaproteobacteria bacterium]
MSHEETARRLSYLDAMGVQVWQARAVSETVVPTVSESKIESYSISDTTVDWDTLAEQVRSCARCPLSQQRTQSVFGVGNRQAEWMIIGEAPGADEDRQGEPFVGRAGKLLDQMLLSIGLPREQVYITNIVKCRPPQNRDPQPEEAAACAGYLRNQIALLKPKIILAVGRIAAHNLLHTDRAVGTLRGRVWTHPETQTPIVVTYHPAYLLRSPSEKRKAWSDLLLARQTLRSVS